MTEQTGDTSRDDLEQQFTVIRNDLATLTRLLREAGEAKADETREAALAEAAALLEKSREALEGGQARAREAGAAVETYIKEKPVQSALIALGVGFLVGMLTRR